MKSNTEVDQLQVQVQANDITSSNDIKNSHEDEADADVDVRTKWLTDAKRFNAQKIRRRMKEHKERTSTCVSTPGKTPRLGKPQLTIAVSMSEEQNDQEDDDQVNADDDDDDKSNNGGINREHSPQQRQAAPSPSVLIKQHMQRQQQQLRQSPLATFLTNNDRSNSISEASAWAMMEHYQNGDSDQLANQLRNPELPQNASFWDKTLTFESYSLQLSSDDSQESSSQSVDYADSSQHIFIPSSPSEVQSPTTRQGQNHRGQVLLWKTPDAKVDAGPTPARVKAHWVQEKENIPNPSPSPHKSILQESLILSDAPSTTGSAFHPVLPRKSSIEQSPQVQQAKLSESHRQPDSRHVTIKDGSIEDLSNISVVQSPAEPLRVFTSTLQPSESNQRAPKATPPVVRTVSGDDNRFDPSNPKIEELERNLKEQQENTAQVQSKLKERVAELEQALRVTAATPRGTVVQENPLKTLLDRNQTLVKEVRFADSTCVELSAKIAALEAENKVLQGKLSNFEATAKNNRAHNTTEQAKTPRLPPNSVTKDSRTSLLTRNNISVDERVLRQVLDELKAEVAALTNENNDDIASTASALLSDINSFEKATEDSQDMDKSFTSQCLAKSLQAQAKLLKKQSQMAKQSTLQQNDSVLGHSQMQDTDADVSRNAQSISEEKLSLDLSRAQNESDFLGRQLGKVQEKLDSTRQELEAEKQRSAAMDGRWRGEAASQLRKIRALEDQLTRATKPTSPTGNVANVGKELAEAKSELVLFRKELERLISSDNLQLPLKPTSTQPSPLLPVLEAAMGRMRGQYRNLQAQVDSIVDHYCVRIESLSNTVTFLRSSLLFEPDSESATGTQTELFTKSASPDVWKSLQDDDAFERMEEARGKPPQFQDPLDEVSEDLESISRFLSDDSTLESIMKGVPEKSVDWESDRWRKPLEAAIRECRRVKEHSTAVKRELQSEKLAFSQLEMENKRLLTDFSRKEAERKSLAVELQEAKSRIIRLQAEVDDIVYSKAIAEERHSAEESRLKALEVEKTHLNELVVSLKEKKQTLENQLNEAKSQLKVTLQSNKQHENTRSELLDELTQLKTKCSSAEDMLYECRCQHEDMRKERAELKRKLSSAENEAESLRVSLTKVKSGVDSEMKQNHETISNLRSWLEETQKQVEQYSSACRMVSDVAGRIVDNNYDSEDFMGSGVDVLARFESIVPLLTEALENAAENKVERSNLLEEISRLREDLDRSNFAASKFKTQVEEEKSQTSKLFDLLRMAEVEMERSANQIREMSSALSKLQQQESTMTAKHRTVEKENEATRRELEQLQRVHSDERIASQQRIRGLTQELASRDEHIENLRKTVDSLESKGTRLRDYVKKLTIKCEEWEESYERQARSMEKMKAKNLRTREKASELASRYKQLSSHVKAKSKGHTEDREKWAGERSDLQRVHAQLEKELETIARELSNVEHENSTP